jgi:quercetin dioxygenase-like cupin family protein
MPTNTTDFESRLARDGFRETLTRHLDPGHEVPAHAHPFDVCALVLDGAITLTTDAGARTYVAGEVFTMEAGREHAESCGPTGVSYLAGRRHRGGAG